MLRICCPILIIAFAGLVGCAGARPSATDQTAIDQADKLHTRIASAVVEDRNPRLKRYFEQLGARIVSAAQELDKQGKLPAHSAGGGSTEWMFSKEIDFHLVASPLPSSFTSGGHHLYIYSGLFQRCQNEDELAAVFCREYAHLYLRHAVRAISRDGIPSQDGDVPLIYPFATLRYPPEFARAADALAFPIFVKAGWDPTRFASVYQRILETAAGDEPIDRGLLKERVADAQRRTEALPAEASEWAQPRVADEARFAQLRAETQTLVQALARDGRAELLLSAFPSALSAADTPIQLNARQRLFPPAAAPTADKWGKGLGGR
ncbi:MAG: M48 family metallopeptidase [Phycisphaerae bacterium]